MAEYNWLRRCIIDTFHAYGGWWQLGGMAEWLDADEEAVDKEWRKLEAEGLLERRRNKAQGFV